jgi:TonB family protein
MIVVLAIICLLIGSVILGSSCATTKPRQAAGVEATLRGEFPGAVLAVDVEAGKVRVVSSAWDQMDGKAQYRFKRTCAERIAMAGGPEDTVFLVNGEEVAVSHGGAASGEPAPSGSQAEPGTRRADVERADGRSTPVDVMPVLLSLPPPIYPAEARKMGTEGLVLVRALVGKDGRVEEVRIFHGVTGLDDAAMDSVRRARFEPALERGEAIRVWVQVPIRFTLN